MILTSISATVPFTPPWRTDPDAPVFHLRAASVIERGAMEAELSSTYRAGKVMGYELRDACRDGVHALLADDPALDRVIGLIDAEAGGEAVTLTDDDKLLLSEVRKVLAEHWPPYRDLMAQLARRRELAPIVALRWFCTAIEAKGVTFAKDISGRLSDATLAQLDPLEMAVAGSRAYGLAYGDDPDTEKNSPPPSSSEDGPAISGSDAPSKAGGKSARKSGRKTLE